MKIKIYILAFFVSCGSSDGKKQTTDGGGGESSSEGGLNDLAGTWKGQCLTISSSDGQKSVFKNTIMFNGQGVAVLTSMTFSETDTTCTQAPVMIFSFTQKYSGGDVLNVPVGARTLNSEDVKMTILIKHQSYLDSYKVTMPECELKLNETTDVSNNVKCAGDFKAGKKTYSAYKIANQRLTVSKFEDKTNDGSSAEKRAIDLDKEHFFTK